jgi:hypothetical protein
MLVLILYLTIGVVLVDADVRRSCQNDVGLDYYCLVRAAEEPVVIHRAILVVVADDECADELAVLVVGNRDDDDGDVSRR